MISNALLDSAYNFASLSLVGKKRYSGETFEDHSLKITEVLKKYDINDPTTLAVAILHHCIHDGTANYSDVEKEFGKEIASMLKTLEDLRIIKIQNTTEAQFAENLRKLFLYLAKDIRIVLIKLA